jgi:hypothetical protein
MLLPIEQMWHRVELARDEDTTFFLHLMYAGELLTKLLTAAFIAAIADDVTPVFHPVETRVRG